MKIYFAHPAFTDDQKAFKRVFLERFTTALRNRCSARNIAVPETVDPFDYGPDIEEHSAADKAVLSRAVATVCCRLLEDCDLVLALIDDNDAGVAFELGFAYANSVPSMLVSRSDAAEKANAMLTGTAQASIGRVLDEGRMETLVDLVCGFAATFVR